MLLRFFGRKKKCKWLDFQIITLFCQKRERWLRQCQLAVWGSWKARSLSPSARLAEMSLPRNNIQNLHQFSHFYWNIFNGRNPVCFVHLGDTHSLVPAVPKVTGKGEEHTARVWHVGVFTLGVEGTAVNTYENALIRNLRTHENKRASLDWFNFRFLSPGHKWGIQGLEVDELSQRVRGEAGIWSILRPLLFPIYWPIC